MDPSFSLEVYPDHPLDLVRARVRYQARGVNHPAPLTARMSVRGNPTAIVTTQPGKNFRYGREHGVELANHAGNRPLHGLLAFHDGPNWKAEANWIVPEISPWPGITYKLEARVLDREGTELSGLLSAEYTHWPEPRGERPAPPLVDTTLQVLLYLPNQNAIDGLAITPPTSGNVLLDPARLPAAPQLMRLVLDHVGRHDPFCTVFSPRLGLRDRGSYWPHPEHHRIDARVRRLAATDAAIAFNTILLAEADQEDGGAPRNSYEFSKPLEVSLAAAATDPDALHAYLAQAKAFSLLGRKNDAVAAMGNLLGRLACLDRILDVCPRGVLTNVAEDILQLGWSKSGWQSFFVCLAELGFTQNAGQRMFPRASAVDVPVLPMDDD